jgi:hypothetical protein
MMEWLRSPTTAPTAILLGLVLRQLDAATTEGERAGFLKAVGADLAAGFPVGDGADLGALQERINGVWQQLDMGEARISLSDDAILIRHSLAGIGPAREHQAWLAAIPAVAEGAYDAWFRALGSGTRLRTHVVTRSAEMIEYRHGV